MPIQVHCQYYLLHEFSACLMYLRWAKYVKKFRNDHLYEPPDGGWGWIVLLGASLSYSVYAYMLSIYSLLFQDKLLSMGYETTGTAVVISCLMTVINLSGLVCAPLVKMFSYQTTAILGSCLFFIGMVTTYFASAIWHLILSYSIIVGFGIGLLTSSNVIALNTYFLKWRATAMGLAFGGTSVAQMFVPQAIVFTLKEYGFGGTILILAAMNLNAIPAALLYHPLCMHSKKKADCTGEEMVPLKGVDTDKKEPEKVSERRTFLQRTVAFFDLDLLADPIFINILFGVMIYYSCNTNMSMLLPLYLRSAVGLSKQDTATCLTVKAAGDVASRAIVPWFFDKFHFVSRHIFIVVIICIAIVRIAVAVQMDMVGLCIALFVEGIFRGLAAVYHNLCISDHCSLQKIPAAVGLSMFFKGIANFGLGPIIGVIRDSTGDYPLCIFILSAIMVASMAFWIIELASERLKKMCQNTNNITIA